jgi:uncharacterized membrane protein affecting hemolysin expression
MRPDRQKWLIALAGGCALILFAQGVWCLREARALQTRLDHVYVAHEAQRLLTPMLLEGAGVRQLRPLVDRLLQRTDLGLRRLAVYDAEGVLLAHAGRFEALRLPLIPAPLPTSA